MFKYYYTLEEALRPASSRPYNPINHTDVTAPNFKDMVNIFYSPVPTWAQKDGSEFPYLNECWQRVRHMFYRDETYFWSSDTEYDVTVQDDLDKLHTEVQHRAIDLIETFYETKDKYIALIQAQENLKADILKNVDSLNETWFNDTPQSAGDYTDTNHTTTYTKQKSSLNLGPVSAKLEEVDKAMNDIYARWVNEFKKFRIY